MKIILLPKLSHFRNLEYFHFTKGFTDETHSSINDSTLIENSINYIKKKKPKKIKKKRSEIGDLVISFGCKQ